jgi:biotin carboxylase
MRHVGVVESNLSGSGFQGIRIAKELGCRVTFFTSGMDRYLSVPGGPRLFEEHVDAIEHCQTNELAPLLERVRTVDAVRPLSALMSMAEYEVVVAAEAARALGLSTPDPESVRIARNKVHMRRRCAAHGVPMPAFVAVDSSERAARAAREVGLPCVVKPADETSSADVRLCTTVEQAVEQFEVIHARKENVRGQRRHHEVLVEECVLGGEVSVEILAAGDRLHVLGVTDKSIGGDGRFVELGHVFPSLLPAPLRDACAKVATDAVRAVGFDLGLAHVEVKHGAGGPKLIEVNPRPAGDMITELVDRSLDISCLELVVRQYLGERVDVELSATAARGAAIRFLTADPGRVVAVAGAKWAASVPGVCEAAISLRKGDLVGPLLRNEDRAGHVLAVGADAAAAARTAERALSRMEVVTVREADVSGAAAGPSEAA